ncbi:MAG: bifunctional [glutamine synthetase] adenylyltransferase/[glutamine synthetase]-adenylyl-L-tyrosine phosphorylase [Actinobacteria bacterium]|nr:bifunctional [glutamine synthetase] adenylyltransferase/[glutamine synthetase]-adenylyl-L-tyrosine phosphorylase [Actinomycetota bacterium]MBU1609795.1 bifunctional [glutamine synthetase] adenylyltransferase/[glutamine synthetase]-adenylyl-L-tyrosine phosphorylase [Actinomycetota bacterium]MBU2316300.1 bifunctional [glutamine synthetase] adenylyltransferase/[glutamine synthetase]-adenylyl-L-tyrosine phosphorylase [Actinomycetota bacterium]MBU2385776.1 bifunctional [glutamine synthetase] adeny
MTRPQSTLTELARVGFTDLSDVRALLETLDIATEDAGVFGQAADPDRALRALARLQEQHPEDVAALSSHAEWSARAVRVVGASEGLADFLRRRPQQLEALRERPPGPLGAATYRAELAAAVEATDDVEQGRVALRVAYRRHLMLLAAWDLEQDDPLQAQPLVSEGLADLAGAALDAALLLARRASTFPAEDVERTKLAIIGMGKAGARELNYISDVDVIYVADAAEGLETARAVEIATRLAAETARGIQDPALEPPLWEVDANLRPEGKDGALVRTLDSHRAYYERWAKSWEFQALLKSRPLAGDAELGQRYCETVHPMVWSISQRDGFVESVQRMRERVTDHIPDDELDVQLKLGPGGLRDIEFTIQLLQLVHGLHDDRVRQPDTLGALASLAEHGYIGRVEAAEFSTDYRTLRVMEHRVQLDQLRRTHLMPRDEDRLRVLARATGLAGSADEIVALWQSTRAAVRSLHEKLFYRPLLTAVASLPEGGLALTSDQAKARLAAIGFTDPAGALRHIAALTSGVSRRAAIQRTLLPVILQWLADGADPDYGLLAFRKLSEALGESYWFLRMLRDSSGAAERLTKVLAASRYVGGLFERNPEGAAWLENDEELRPRSLDALLEETRATVARHDGDTDAAAKALRTARQREILRLALSGILDVSTIQEVGRGLTAVTTALLTGVLSLAHRPDDGIEFAIIGMGRYGGGELGFGSDTDVIYVYRDGGAGERAQATAEGIVRDLGRLTEDLRLPLDLDADLRPEGKNGPMVRSLDSYRAYYARWSLTWEAQALLRAHAVAGDDALGQDFLALADTVRYPAELPASDAREVRRIKARVESERLPQAADPARHVKLGRGSLSDVEWFVQLLQLQHAASQPALKTTSTLEALDAVVEAGLVTELDAAKLRDAWIIASRVRSALTLWLNKTADVLPDDRLQLEGIARLMGYPPGCASQLEEDYLRTTRLARQVFERGFYDA